MRLRIRELYGDLRHTTTVPGLRRFGVPTGGAFDNEAAELTAAICGCATDELLELSFGKVRFEVERAGRLVVIGAGAPQELQLVAGASVELVPQHGARLVLGTDGGFAKVSPGADPEQGLACRLGGAVETCVPTSDESVRSHPLPRTVWLDSLQRGIVYVVAGPQRNLWPNPDRVRGSFSVGHALDRHGVRLEGGPLHTHELISEPCITGAIQWTPGGELIVIGPDGPTVGGYPKPFVVLPSFLPRVAQLLPGGRLTLVEVDRATARMAEEGREAVLRTRVAAIRTSV